MRKETVEMVDGRLYASDDNWETVWLSRGGRNHRRVLDKQEADLVRYLAACQSRATADD